MTQEEARKAQAGKDAIELVQQMGAVTMFDMEFNEGYSLPFHVAKKCALMAVDRLIQEEEGMRNGEDNPVYYWKIVKEELLKLEL